MSIADALQGHGLGSILITHVAQAAQANGIDTFSAKVLPENHRMIDVFRRSGFAVRIRAVPGEVEVEFPTEITERAAERYEEREDEAAAAAVRRLLAPNSVAVIGASRDPASIGGRLLHNLLSGPFQGVVHPVNPSAPAVQGVTASPTVLDVAGEVDVAFIAVPAARVLEVARQCGEKGVRGLIVISSGFGETGPEGLALQHELLGICRASGMRLIGPNCMGVVNTDPGVLLNGTFATVYPPAGRVGVPVAERRPRARGDGARGRARARPVDLRLGGQQGRHLGQRPALLLGAGRAHRPAPALPRELRQPAPLRPARAPRRPHEADRRGEVRAQRRGPARGLVTHGRTARRERHHGRCALPPARRDQDRHPRGDVRRRHACWPTSRCRPATGSRSSRTPAGSASCAPIPARRTT